MNIVSASPQIRTLQIIAGALIVGLFSLGVILALLAQGAAVDVPIITYVAGFLLLSNSLQAVLLPARVVQAGLRRQAREPANPEKDAFFLLAKRQTTLILILAMFEAAGLTAAIAYFLERNLAAIAVWVCALLCMAWNYPTTGRIHAWLDLQERRLEELRHGP